MSPLIFQMGRLAVRLGGVGEGLPVPPLSSYQARMGSQENEVIVVCGKLAIGIYCDGLAWVVVNRVPGFLQQRFRGEGKWRLRRVDGQLIYDGCSRRGRLRPRSGVAHEERDQADRDGDRNRDREGHPLPETQPRSVLQRLVLLPAQELASAGSGSRPTRSHVPGRSRQQDTQSAECDGGCDATRVRTRRTGRPG